MPLNPLNHHYAMENPVSIYDEEAMTALELAGRTTAKVNETVRAFNELESKTNSHLENQDNAITKMNNETMPQKVVDEVQSRIDSGEFDQAINEYAGDLSGRVNNLLGKVSEGSTTMDAEIIDGRHGEDNKDYANIGEAIRSQIGKTLRVVSHSFTNANDMEAPGIYFKGGDPWENVPPTLGNFSAFIMTLAPGANQYRVMQVCFDWYGNVAIRRKLSATGWTDWYALAKEADSVARDEALGKRIDALKPLQYIGTSNTLEWDADTITETGLYFLGDAHTKYNTPTDNGLLIVYKGGASHNLYQMWWDYHGSGLYFRNFVYNSQSFRDWTKFLNSGEISGGATTAQSASVYTVAKVTNNKFYIYRKGNNGFIRYSYYRHINSSVNLDTYRLEGIAHLNNSKQLINTISDSGADLEGVVYLEGESDHVGGVHGDEKATNYYLFIDGKQYTMDNLPASLNCDEVRIIVESNITHMDSTNVCMRKVKHTTFDKDGVHVNCEWEALEELAIKSIRSCMFSIDKDSITHYYDSNVNRVPLAVPAQSGTSTLLHGDNKITDIIYVGNVTAHHWAGERGGDSSGYSTYIYDYDTRMKSYFNCYDGHTAQAGEKMYAVNHFTVGC